MVVNEIVQLLDPVIRDLGYELWGCEYLAQGKYSLLRIYIDRDEGIGIDDCERVSRQVSSVLDVEDPIPGEYRLEVSSPGMPRPLFYAWQYERYIGCEAKVKLYQPILGRKNLMATIVAVDGDDVELLVDGAQHKISISDIAKASLIVE